MRRQTDQVRYQQLLPEEEKAPNCLAVANTYKTIGTYQSKAPSISPLTYLTVPIIIILILLLLERRFMSRDIWTGFWMGTTPNCLAAVANTYSTIGTTMEAKGDMVGALERYERCSPTLPKKRKARRYRLVLSILVSGLWHN
jgi:hypothetical protein